VVKALVKLKELLLLADIMYERLRDQEPGQELLRRCLEPVWPYIYPYGTISYLKKHGGISAVEIDRRKTQKMLRALNGSRRKWLSFTTGLCYTYRERHSLQRNRARLVQKALRLKESVSTRELDDLAEQFRRQALQYARVVKEIAAGLANPAEAEERSKLAKTLCNEENVPRFLLFYRHIDCERLLELAPGEVLEKIKHRYDNPTAQNLCFDLLQEYIALDDGMWQQFKKLLGSAGRYS
jgi:hypothetical protein